MAALFMAYFLKVFGLRDFSAFVGGFLYGFSAHMIYYISQFYLNQLILIPLLFLFTEKIIRENSRKSSVLLIIISALYFSGANPQPAIIDTLAIFFYLIFRLFFFSETKRKRKFFLIISSYILGFLITSPFWFLFFEFFSQAKSHHPATFTGTYLLSNLIHLFAPVKIGGSPIHEGFLPYIGTSGIIFATFGLIFSTPYRKKYPLFFSFLIFLFFTITFKFFWPSKLLMRYSIPVISKIAYLKYNHIIYFSLSVMAAFGLESLIIENRIAVLKLGFIVLLLITIFMILRFFCSQGFPIPWIGWLIIWGFIIFIITLFFKKYKNLFPLLISISFVVELFIYAPNYHPERCEPYKKPPFVKFLKEIEKKEPPFRIFGIGGVLTPYTNAVFSISDIRTVSPLILKNYHKFWDRFILYHPFPSPFFINSRSFAPVFSRYIDLLGCKYIVSEGDIFKRYNIDKLNGECLNDKRYFELFMQRITINDFNPFKVKKITDNGVLVSLPFYLKGKIKISDPNFLKILVSFEEKPTNITLFLGKKRVNKIREDKKNFLFFKKFEHKALEGDIPFLLKIDGRANQKCWIYPKLIPDIKLTKAISDYKKIFYDQKTNVYIYKNKSVLPLAFIVRDFIWVKGVDDAFNKVAEIKDFQKKIAIEGGKEFILNFLQKDKKQKNDRIKFIKIEPQRIQIKVKTESPGFLVILNSFYPGWQAFIDGKSVKIFRVDGLFQGIFIPQKGIFTVDLKYFPLSLYIGISITILSLIISIFLVNMKKI